MLLKGGVLSREWFAELADFCEIALKSRGLGPSFNAGAMIETTNLFTTGIYSVPDAARLTGISTGRIRRWLRGYRYRSHEKQYHSPPLWRGQLQPIGGSLALGFRDLIEIKFVDAFLDAGVSWAMLRKVHERAAKLFPTASPFAQIVSPRTAGIFSSNSTLKRANQAWWKSRAIKRCLPKSPSPSSRNSNLERMTGLCSGVP